MKIVTIIGARPQFIKAATVSSSLSKNNVKEVMIHTGQHYDKNMSEIFFQEMNIPEPGYNLGVNSPLHGAMTGRMLEKIEEILLAEKPNVVLVYGDTNSTLAGAMAASKLHIPIAHIEAGLRSFNRKMPEEINRVVTDHLSEALFSPTALGVANLKKEGITKGVYHTGDVMFDAALLFGDIAIKKSNQIETLKIDKKNYYLTTVHRAENTDDPQRLKAILTALKELNKKTPVIFPLHPRTKKHIQAYQLSKYIESIKTVEPLSYLEMVALEKHAKVIITDSGGVQKEAYFHGVPCVTLRDETEWVETVEAGWNTIAGADSNIIVEAVRRANTGGVIEDYGKGKASDKIVGLLRERFA